MTNFAKMNHLPQNMIQEKLRYKSLHDYMFVEFSLSYPEDKDSLSELFNFAFIRHPFERLVSAFHDKFITIEQLPVMKPYIDYYIMLNGIQDKVILEHQWVKRHVKVTFENFANFVLYEHSLKAKMPWSSWHWSPFCDLCKICEIDYTFIGKFESLEEDVECLLDKFPEYELLQGIRSELKHKVNAYGQHNENMTMEYFTQLSKGVILQLYKMYEIDFLIGGYEYPRAYINSGRTNPAK